MQSTNKNTVEIQFRKVNDAGNNPSFSVLPITPENITVPKDQDKLSFILKLTGDFDISLYNPIYYLKIQVLDQGKKPLFIKQKPSVLLLNLNRLIDPKEDFTFTITGAKQNKELLDLSEAVNAPIIHFEPNSSYSYLLEMDLLSLKLTHVLDEAGPYYLLISGNLVCYDTKDKTKASNPFHTKAILLNY